MCAQAVVVALLFALFCLVHQVQAYGSCTPDDPTVGSKSNSGSQQKDECTAPCLIDCSGCPEYDDEVEPATTVATTETTTESSTSAPSTSTVNSTEPCPCLLVKKLNKLKYNLTVSDQIIFEGCMNKIRPVLVDSSKSADKKISWIAHHLRKCFRKNVNIKQKMKHEKIGRWGGLYKFLLAGLSIDNDYIDFLITLDGAGKCPLTNAIEVQTIGDNCGTGSSSLILVFTGKVKKILKRLTNTFHKGRKLSWFKKLLFKHLLLNSAVNRDCVLNVQVTGFDSLDHFADSCEQSETSSSAIDYLSGTGTGCKLIYSLDEGLKSSTSSADIITLQEGHKYKQELIDFFAQNSDLEHRIDQLSFRYSLLSRACRRLLKPFKILGTFLDIDFSDVISTSHHCTNNGCGNMNYGSPSVTYPETCQNDEATNSSVVEDGCTEFEKTLTSMEKMQWNSYKNSIVNCIRKLHPGDFPAKLECVKYYVRGYCNNFATMKSRLLATELFQVLIESATDVKHGNFGTMIS